MKLNRARSPRTRREPAQWHARHARALVHVCREPEIANRAVVGFPNNLQARSDDAPQSPWPDSGGTGGAPVRHTFQRSIGPEGYEGAEQLGIRAGYCHIEVGGPGGHARDLCVDRRIREDQASPAEQHSVEALARCPGLLARPGRECFGC